MDKYIEIINCINENLNVHSLIGKSNYLLEAPTNCKIFIHNKILISITRLAENISKTSVPFIDNYKIFLDDNLYYQSAELPFDPFFKYIELCILNPNIKGQSFSKINTLSDFCEVMNKYNISIDCSIPEFQYLHTDLLNKSPDEYIKIVYFLYGIIISKYLETQDIDLTQSNPFNIDNNKKLNKINIYTPIEEQITLHYFCLAYLRTAEQRNKDYPAIFDISSWDKKYTYSEIIPKIYSQYADINDMHSQLRRLLLRLYKAVNLDYVPEKDNKIVTISHADYSIIVLWYMLYHHEKSVKKESLVIMPVSESSENIIDFFASYNLENLNDYDTLCTDRKIENKGAIVNTFIMNAASEEYIEIDCTRQWYKIVENAINPSDNNPYLLMSKYVNIPIYSFLYEQLKNIYFQLCNTYHSVNILDEYKYYARLYNFSTGIDAMKTVYTSIYNNFDKLKKIELPSLSSTTPKA